MSKGHYSRGGKWCIHCGITAGRISRAYADGDPLPCIRPDTPCGHPLAARAIQFDGLTHLPRTVCWACQVDMTDTRHAQIDDNTGGGVSTESNSMLAATAAVLLTPGDGRRAASRE